jgi:hypothetical protein
MLTAAEKYTELQEVTVKYGRRAEIALTILQEQQSVRGLACEPRIMKRFIQFLALA